MSQSHTPTTTHHKAGNDTPRLWGDKRYHTWNYHLRQHNIRVCCHIIYGLPQETDEMMLETAREVSKLDIQGLKIHLLHVLKFTPMVRQYEQGLLQFLEKVQYVNLVVKTLEMMPPELIIHRVTGDGPGDLLIGPMWSVNKWDVLNSIDRELKNRNTWQGKLWNPAIRLEQKKVVQK
ncbi:hypothetical protein GCM10010965_22750 [Caldalkalibacillus thermarum]|nr:hypothetical protein GCM10010965_22750 [Caldalkalibacillus thermarum]